MRRIVAFGASNSKQSINKQLAVYAAHTIEDAEVTILDLNDFEMPIYSIDREKDSGIPEPAHKFKEQIKESEGIILSLAEHNGAYSSAFKNIFDWISRIDKNVWENKPMLLLSTAPGPMGGKNVLAIALSRFARMNTNKIFSFSLPSFGLNFSHENGISKEVLNKEFSSVLTSFTEAL